MITNQQDLRRAFWEAHPTLIRRRHRYSWDGKSGELVHHVDTRVTWVDWIDYMQRTGQISADLAQRAELSGK